MINSMQGEQNWCETQNGATTCCTDERYLHVLLRRDISIYTKDVYMHIPATSKRITITDFGSIGGACTYIYYVTPKAGKQAFLYIENL